MEDNEFTGWQFWAVAITFTVFAIVFILETTGLTDAFINSFN